MLWNPRACYTFCVKQLLRGLILNKRKRLSLKQKKQKDLRIWKKLLNFKLFRKAGKVLFYISKSSEVDTRKIIQESGFRLQKHIIAPKVAGRKLKLFEITCFKDVGKGAFGILEPKKHCKKINPQDIDLAIVPGIAFDKKGHRIGYGKGYFDRLLRKMKCKKIGLAYDFQIVDKIPKTAYDIPVDFIITDKKIYVCNAKNRSGGLRDS